jgi:hypothetical protein
VAAGVWASWPGQKGHWGLNSGSGGLPASSILKSWGLFARSLAMITHSLLSRFCLNSGMARLSWFLSQVFIVTHHT